MSIKPSDLANAVVGALDGDYDDGLGVWISAHVDSNPHEVWVELTADGGAPAGTYRITVEDQSTPA